MPETLLRQPGFTYCACGPFTKNKEEIQKIKETGDSRYIYLSKTDKAWLIEILKSCLEEQLLIKYCVIKHLILLKHQDVMDIKEVLLQRFTNFSIKNLQVMLLHMLGQRP